MSAIPSTAKALAPAATAAGEAASRILARLAAPAAILSLRGGIHVIADMNEAFSKALGGLAWAGLALDGWVSLPDGSRAEGLREAIAAGRDWSGPIRCCGAGAAADAARQAFATYMPVPAAADGPEQGILRLEPPMERRSRSRQPGTAQGERPEDGRSGVQARVHGRTMRAMGILTAIANRSAPGVRDPKGRAALSRMRMRAGYLGHILDIMHRIGGGDARTLLQRQAETLCAEIVDLRWEDRDPHAVRLTVSASPLDWPSERVLDLFYVVYELMVNALRHGMGAAGGAISVHVGRDGGLVRISVEDDGPGLSPDGLVKEGFGLSMVETIVRNAGGMMSFGSGPGCAVRIRMPI